MWLLYTQNEDHSQRGTKSCVSSTRKSSSDVDLAESGLDESKQRENVEFDEGKDRRRNCIEIIVGAK